MFFVFVPERKITIFDYVKNKYAAVRACMCRFAAFSSSRGFCRMPGTI